MPDAEHLILQAWQQDFPFCADAFADRRIGAPLLREMVTGNRAGFTAHPGRLAIRNAIITEVLDLSHLVGGPQAYLVRFGMHPAQGPIQLTSTDGHAYFRRLNHTLIVAWPI